MGPDADSSVVEASIDASETGTDSSVPKDCLLPKNVDAPSELKSQMKFCDLDKMLAIDGDTGGIYRDTTTTTINADGHTIASCAAFDFGARVDPLSLEVHAKASKKTCGHMCSTSVPSGDGCDSGDFFWVFAGPTLNVMDSKFVTEITLQKPMSIVEMLTFDKTFPSVDVRYIFVCRANGSPDRDDVEIDGIKLCPR